MKRDHYKPRKNYSRHDVYHSLPHHQQFQSKFQRLFTRRIGRRGTPVH